MSENVNKVIEIIEKMTVLELAELIKSLEEKFGVKAQPVVGVAPTVAPKEEKKEEKTEFDVILKSYGENKIPVIRVVKNIVGKGLLEVKNLVESAPNAVIKEKVSRAEAERIVKELESVGAVCEIR